MPAQGVGWVFVLGRHALQPVHLRLRLRGWVGDICYEGHVFWCWGWAPRLLRGWKWWSWLVVDVLVIGRQLMDNWS